jgi:cyclopropane-fatty-acyl-phospholipid synthase
MTLTQLAIDWTEQGLLPDAAVRAGIRRLLRRRLEEIRAGDSVAAAAATDRFVAHMQHAPIALLPDKANAQHYEVPADFYALALGAQRKYSCCLWSPGVTHLQDAETTALQTTCARSITCWRSALAGGAWRSTPRAAVAAA